MNKRGKNSDIEGQEIKTDGIDINSIKRRTIIRYPIFENIIANLRFKTSEEIMIVGTDGEQFLYNPNFLKTLSKEQQTFVFAHVICHIAFEHIYRSKGKNKDIWDNATDAVINALLKEDGLTPIEGRSGYSRSNKL